MVPPEDELDPFKKIRLDRARMEWEWRFRQENLLPLETAYNWGRFFGLALKGRQILSLPQRVGFLSPEF